MLSFVNQPMNFLYFVQAIARLRQMAIFRSLSKWIKHPLDLFSIKTNKILGVVS